MDRATLALAEAIIPGTSTIPGADDTTVRQVTELVSRLSPKLARAWTSANRALDAAARLRTGRPPTAAETTKTSRQISNAS